MVNCEICKQKITLSNIYVDKETGKATKYCRFCVDKAKKEEKKDMGLKRGEEDLIQEIEKEQEVTRDQDMIKDAPHIENISTGSTDIVTRDILIDSINSYLGEDPLNIKDGDYCYIRMVRNHIEIGRAKVVMEE